MSMIQNDLCLIREKEAYSLFVCFIFYFVRLFVFSFHYHNSVRFIPKQYFVPLIKKSNFDIFTCNKNFILSVPRTEKYPRVNLKLRSKPCILPIPPLDSQHMEARRHTCTSRLCVSRLAHRSRDPCQYVVTDESR